MALSLTLKRLPFAISLLYIAISCCQAQQADPVQIVARAALCFDNRPVLNNCLTSMGVNVGGTNSSAQQNISTTTFCNGPCFGQMMLMTNCINGILSNFQFYNPGMMQGVQAIFQTACGQNSNNGVAANNNGGGSGGSANMVGASNYGIELAIPMYMSLWMPALLVAIWLL
ncbi:uncharacterized protein LOC108511080 [Phoenix dactylifera]|uniref:Uncharacterized protein LOC108511080 n=1 Tax=Phoenix dactylifera TaxID=42345 RepID=A0A8B7MSV2_PHODC|nr:uncharacterized protein LOC108511080 [Phoenix dactylifera]